MFKMLVGHSVKEWFRLKSCEQRTVNKQKISNGESCTYAGLFAGAVGGAQSEKAFKQIIAYFQPQYVIDTGAIYGSEALARLRCVESEGLGPAYWMSYLNTVELRSKLWGRMLDQALDFLRYVNNPHFCVSVNASADIASSIGWAEDLVCRVLEYQLDPHSITVEITEDISCLDESKLAESIKYLRLCGFSCAIDDFGTGYSSLHRLASMEFNSLKIDQKLVHQARKCSKGKKILSHTVDMARDLGFIVIAEGVETEEDLENVTILGCDVAQGFYFSKPVTAENFICNFSSSMDG
ncbi:EAL domain-containing protein [Pseudomonas sp. CCM 7893]|uniref:EAL domain-containing protein n=1 Tax=Pseudomonas spelaei TaxID=1055469 RepID=A0A6I3WC52_9PSED|nr:EAL domain-containing protein [Pseudomonas spelaei]MUF08310.1 EAL domain-containing protein [Pseudomonas spelaei]